MADPLGFNENTQPLHGPRSYSAAASICLFTAIYQIVFSLQHCCCPSINLLSSSFFFFFNPSSALPSRSLCYIFSPLHGPWVYSRPPEWLRVFVLVPPGITVRISVNRMHTYSTWRKALSISVGRGEAFIDALLTGRSRCCCVFHLSPCGAHSWSSRRALGEPRRRIEMRV